jgi:hypothetical protein
LEPPGRASRVLPWKPAGLFLQQSRAIQWIKRDEVVFREAAFLFVLSLAIAIVASLVLEPLLTQAARSLHLL